jgi:Trk K+ transport system NAD-binding subunit
MSNWRQRIVWALTTVVLVVALYSVGYRWAMGVYEEEQVSITQAVQVVVEAITTTGFGGHAPWATSEMNLIILLMNLTGVAFVFLAVPVFLLPLFREVFETHPPTASDATDHVIICEYSPRGEAFIAELQARGYPYVIVESDREVATTLHERGQPVVLGDPESTHVLRAANLQAAQGVVADAEDDVNASIALSVREIRSDVPIVTLLEDPALEVYHRLAGATEVLSPRQLLGASLARQVPTVMTTLIDEGVSLDDHVEIVEIKVEAHSEVCGRTLRRARLREEYGFDVIGAWSEGTFTSPVSPGLRLHAGMRLLVAGPPGRMQALQEGAASTVQRFSRRQVVIAGYGRAGQAAASTLEDTSVDVQVLDILDRDPVDVVGDVRQPEVLERAGIREATAAIITVNDDTTAIFATLVMRELNPELYIIVRANREEDEQKLYRAGADYVQSLATVSGRMMASTLVEDEEIFTFEAQVEIVDLPAGRLAGETLATARVRNRTGATVLAVLRDETTISDPDPTGFTFAEGDHVVVAGTGECIRTFEAEFLHA